MKRWLPRIEFLLLVLALVAAFIHIAVQFILFLQGLHAADAAYYWTVGRGMLNGLLLYTDIFDTKPPAIYLLSALSLYVFGDGTIGNWLNALVLLLIPALCGLAAFRLFHDPEDRRIRVLSATLFGSLLALYGAYHTQGWQAEWYGSLFGCLYVFFLLQHKESTGWRRVVLLSAPLFFALAFKEPFLLTTFAAALLLIPDRRRLLKSYVMPIGIVALAGILALLIFGYFDGYFTVYLPSHFGHHLVRSMPLWLRGIQLDLPLINLAEFSYVFALLILVLIVSLLWCGMRAGDFRNAFKQCFLVLLALYLTSLAGNLRGYPASNHFVAAIPFFMALYFAFVRTCPQFPTMHRVVNILIAANLLLLPAQDINIQFQMMSETRDAERTHREVASSIDAILDVCGIDRYFFIENKPYMPYTQHSPQNFFVYIGPEAVVYHHPGIIDRQLQSFSSAHVIVAEGESYEISERPEEKLLAEQVLRYIAQHFTIDPPSCAQSLPLPEGYSILYRKEGGSMAPFPYRLKE